MAASNHAPRFSHSYPHGKEKERSQVDQQPSRRASQEGGPSSSYSYSCAVTCCSTP